MAKKLIQSLMQRLNMIPNKDNIAQNKSLKFLGDKLHQPHLWHINRHSVARAFAVGGFAMYTPPLPWQMIIAAVLAVYFEANLPISVALVWITNPLTWIPLYYVAYSLGAFLLGREGYTFADFKSVFDSLGDAWENLGAPFLVGCFGMMVLCAIAGYFGIQAFWRYHVLSAWEKRKQRRREARRRVFEAIPCDESAAELPQGEAKAFAIVLLERFWKKVGAPFLASCAAFVSICAAAAIAGSKVGVRYFRIMNAWEKRRNRRQPMQTPSVDNPPDGREAAQGAQQLSELAALAESWKNKAGPLLDEALRIAALGVRASGVGVNAAWRSGLEAWGYGRT